MRSMLQLYTYVYILMHPAIQRTPLIIPYADLNPHIHSTFTLYVQKEFLIFIMDIIIYQSNGFF